MRKQIALKSTVLCVALLFATAVAAAPRDRATDAPADGSSASSSRSSGSSFSIQRMFSERLRLSFDVFRGVRGLESPNQSEPGLGTLTIVDVPDPIVLIRTPADGAGDEPDETQKRRQAEQDAINEGKQPTVKFN